MRKHSSFCTIIKSKSIEDCVVWKKKKKTFFHVFTETKLICHLLPYLKSTCKLHLTSWTDWFYLTTALLSSHATISTCKNFNALPNSTLSNSVTSTYTCFNFIFFSWAGHSLFHLSPLFFSFYIEGYSTISSD